MALNPKVRKSLLGSILIAFGAVGGYGGKHVVDFKQIVDHAMITNELHALSMKVEDQSERMMNANPFDAILIKKEAKEVRKRLEEIRLSLK
jgi:hypothetical protein